MYYVYALYSKQYDKIYIGFSTNATRRLTSHNHPKSKGWTSKFQPWILLYSEEHMDRKDAIRREKELKSYRGRKFVRSLIEGSTVVPSANLYSRDIETSFPSCWDVHRQRK